MKTIQRPDRPQGGPPNRPAPQTYTVISRTLVTPNMLRLTLGGAGVAALRPNAEGGYLKMRFPGSDEARPAVRSYTIRHQRAESIDVDFVIHAESGHSGPAVTWAISAEPGDEIMAGGPGPAKTMPAGMDRYLIAGDMTALPAISVNLEALDPAARGVAVIEVQSEEDMQPLSCPDGVQVFWLINPEPGTQPTLLADALRDAGWEEGETYAWAAAEFGSMQALRSYLRDGRGLDRDHLYISSYWKYGESDEDHRVAKTADGVLAG